MFAIISRTCCFMSIIVPSSIFVTNTGPHLLCSVRKNAAACSDLGIPRLLPIWAVPWDASDLSLLCDGDFHPQTFIESVVALQTKTIDMIRSFQDSEIGKWDFSMLYLLYKKLEAMSITTDTTECVQPYLYLLNEMQSR